MKATNPASIDLTNGEFAHANWRSHRLRNRYEQNVATREVIDFVASWELGGDNAKLFPSIVGSSWTISSVCRCSRNF